MAKFWDTNSWNSRLPMASHQPAPTRAAPAGVTSPLAFPFFFQALWASLVFSCCSLYSNLHKPQTPRVPGLPTPPELSPNSRPFCAFTSCQSNMLFHTFHHTLFLSAIQTAGSLVLFLMGCGLSLDTPPKAADTQSASAVLSQAVHHLYSLPRYAIPQQPAWYFTVIVSRFGETTWNS